MKISVLTPTYNRAHTLPDLYKSLLDNKKYCNDFEWIIMDDGSTDNTDILIQKWIKENKIRIKYHHQQNQGKMAALNNMLKYITGELTIECDSDDYFTEDCFLNVLKKYEDIKDCPNISGLAFLRVTKDGKTIGTKFPKKGVYSVYDAYLKHGVKGDKCLIFKSEVRKQYKHKLENKERFTTEGRMYHEMDLKYDGLMCYNIPGVVCEYLDDGYTKNILNVFKTSPHGHYYYYKEMFDHNMNGITFKKRLHIIKHYILFSQLTNKKKINVIKETKGLLNKLLVTLLVIPGYMKTKKVFKVNKKVLFISSTGGHLSEMLQLSSLFEKFDYHIITEYDKTTKSMKNKYKKKIDFLRYGTKDRPLSYMFVFPYNCIRAFRLFLKINPDIILTTGAHTAVPMCYIGKLFRKKVIFIESFANSETRTLSGRLVYPIADVFIVQWEEMLRYYPKAIYGGWIY